MLGIPVDVANPPHLQDPEKYPQIEYFQKDQYNFSSRELIHQRGTLPLIRPIVTGITRKIPG
jgi:hypothetical protein